MGLRARYLVGEILFTLTRIKGARNTIRMLQLRREVGGIGTADCRSRTSTSSSSAVDIDEVWRRWRGLLCEITPADAGVGLKGFAGAEGRVGRG